MRLICGVIKIQEVVVLAQSRNKSSITKNQLAKIKRLKKRQEKIISNESAGTKSRPHPKSFIYKTSSLSENQLKDPREKLELPSKYDPQFVEKGWYDWWEKNNVFYPNKSSKDTFSMVIPPPNVTGDLHLGHALTITLEDILCRWNRMKGKQVVWVPGCDHAGIATQAIVEKYLSNKNVLKNELTKQEFLSEIWKWKNNKQDIIYKQIRKLGASLDWSKSVFTLDPNYTEAVNIAFVELYKKNLIYRNVSLVNWCSHLGTAISNIEVDYLAIEKPTAINLPGYEKPVIFGELHEFSYKLVEARENVDEICVSTTRIETVFGDTAIAVHPSDNRYKFLIGEFVYHPLLNGVTLRIIADENVEPNFGTGAVKVTPAHDYKDFEIGQKHKLEIKNIMNDSGNLVNITNTEYNNMPRFDARQKVINALKQLNQYKQCSPHKMLLPLCSRSGDVIEPSIKSQWFVDLPKLSQPALHAVESGEVKLIPESHLKNWNTWLKSADRWCISRQLWWGHKIPAYQLKNSENKEEWIVAESKQSALIQAKRKYGENITEEDLIQDDDVLDSWFSSSLFPFAALGWPHNFHENKKFYPLNVMETGYDLLYFWVARMLMVGIALTGEVPFKTVFLHPMIRDSHGRKMSKSLGNVIDPLHVINGIEKSELLQNIENSILSPEEKKISSQEVKKNFPQGIPNCGTDALRFTLTYYKATGSDINFDINSVVTDRQFCNKVWNAFKFMQHHFEQVNSLDVEQHTSSKRPIDVWIRSRLASTHNQIQDCLQSFKFSGAAAVIHNFWLRDVCDVYIESCKQILREDSSTDKEQVLLNLHFIIDGGLRLLSPFMPYISEELWQRRPLKIETDATSIGLMPPLHSEEDINLGLEAAFLNVFKIIQSLRSSKQLFQLPKSCCVHLHSMNESDKIQIESFLDVIKDLSSIDNVVMRSSLVKGTVCLEENIQLSQSLIKVKFLVDDITDVKNKVPLIQRRVDKILKKSMNEKNDKLQKYNNFLKLMKGF